MPAARHVAPHTHQTPHPHPEPRGPLSLSLSLYDPPRAPARSPPRGAPRGRYRILVEWDELELAEEADETGDDGRRVLQSALARRSDDTSWTIVSWELSRYSGRWLLNALTVTE